MKICPNCNETNGDSNVKCFHCGAALPVTQIEPTKKQAGAIAKKPNSQKISDLAAIVVVIGIIAGVIAGLLYRTSSVSNLLKSFNWFLFIGAVVGAVCLAIILMALSYVAKAIEEK